MGQDAQKMFVSCWSSASTAAEPQTCAILVCCPAFPASTGFTPPRCRKSQGECVWVSVNVKHSLVHSGAQHDKGDNMSRGCCEGSVLSDLCYVLLCMLMDLWILIKHRCRNTSRNAFSVTPLFSGVFLKGEAENVATSWRKGLAISFVRNERGESLSCSPKTGSDSGAMGQDLLVSLHSVLFRYPSSCGWYCWGFSHWILIYLSRNPNWCSPQDWLSVMKPHLSCCYSETEILCFFFPKSCKYWRGGSGETAWKERRKEGT